MPWFLLGGQVIAEWSRCPGSMPRRVRDSVVAPLRRSSADWLPARIWRLSTGIGRRHPATVRKALLVAGSKSRVWALWYSAGEQFSTVEWTIANVGVLNAVAPTPQPERASRLKSATHDVRFLQNLFWKMGSCVVEQKQYYRAKLRCSIDCVQILYSGTWKRIANLKNGSKTTFSTPGLLFIS